MTSQYFLDRVAGRDRSVRASDADRERIAERLRTGHAEGRLDMEEFQQRLGDCYEAKTFGQLRDLVSDLPRERERRERGPLGWLGPSRRSLPLLLSILAVLLVVSAAAGHHAFWLWVPLMFLFWRVSWWRRRRSWAGGRHGWDGPV
jgi:Domain of unknown function (DUF1707)